MDFNDAWSNNANYTRIQNRTITTTIVGSEDSYQDGSNMGSNNIDINLESYNFNVDSQELFQNLEIFNNIEMPPSQNENEPIGDDDAMMPNTLPEPPVPLQGAVPSNNNFPGAYKFEIGFDPQPEKISKTLTWTYSQAAERMYVSAQKMWPLRFKCGNPPPENSFVRATMIYSAMDMLNVVVTRCPMHILAHDPTNADYLYPEHVLRCSDINTMYQTAPDSRRFTLAVPYTPPQAGNDFSHMLFSMMCLTSCVGGMNRRPTEIIFTLEHNGEIIGRSTLKIKCCASPGRDRQSDEAKLLKESRKRAFTRQSSTDSTGSTTRRLNLEVDQLHIKRPKTENPRMYNIQVDNETDYKMLLKIASGLKLLRSVQTGTTVVSRTDNEEEPRLSQPGPSGIFQKSLVTGQNSQTSISSDEGSQRVQRLTLDKMKIKIEMNEK